MTPFSEDLRRISRAGRFGSETYSRARAMADYFGPFPRSGPDEGMLMGARTAGYGDPPMSGLMGGGDWRCERRPA